MIGLVKYAGNGEVRRVFVLLSGEGWAWRRRWVREIQREGEREEVMWSLSVEERKEGM